METSEPCMSEAEQGTGFSPPTGAHGFTSETPLAAGVLPASQEPPGAQQGECKLHFPPKTLWDLKRLCQLAGQWPLVSPGRPKPTSPPNTYWARTLNISSATASKTSESKQQCEPGMDTAHLNQKCLLFLIPIYISQGNSTQWHGGGRFTHTHLLLWAHPKTTHHSGSW